jgi:hypothetical protein
MGNGQWAMGNGQWAMGNGQWAIDFWRRKVIINLNARELFHVSRLPFHEAIHDSRFTTAKLKNVIQNYFP